MSKNTNTKSKLTAKQEKFCLEYIVDLNATAAAKRAGYSKKAPSESGYALLQIPTVQEKIHQLVQERNKRLEIKADFVLQQLLNIANSDVGRVFNDKNEMLSLQEMPSSIRKSISSVEVDELFDGVGRDRYQIGETKKIKFWNKPKALELLGKHLKLFTDKVEHSGSVTLEKLVLGSMEDDEDEK